MMTRGDGVTGVDVWQDDQLQRRIKMRAARRRKNVSQQEFARFFLMLRTVALRVWSTMVDVDVGGDGKREDLT